MSIQLDEDLLMDISTERRNDINLLLLGDNGVGKTTFINMFSTYLSYEIFEDLEFQGLTCPALTSFVLFDDNHDRKFFITNNSKPETQFVGSPIQNIRTKAVQEHVVTLVGRRFRFIDTPDLSRNNHKCKDHYKADVEVLMMDLLMYDYLNGIVVFLKSDTSEFESYTKSALVEIFKKIPKVDVMFVLTHARYTFYRPGNALAAINDIYRFKDETMKEMFCFDNESLQYLVASKYRHFFNRKERDLYRKSWKVSQNSCKRFADYASALTPKDILNSFISKSLKTKMDNLYNQLADIILVIEENLLILENYKNFVGETSCNVDQIMFPFVVVKGMSLFDKTMPVMGFHDEVPNILQYNYSRPIFTNIPNPETGIGNAVYRGEGQLYMKVLDFRKITADKQNEMDNSTQLAMKLLELISALEQERNTILQTIGQFNKFQKSTRDYFLHFLETRIRQDGRFPSPYNNLKKIYTDLSIHQAAHQDIKRKDVLAQMNEVHKLEHTGKMLSDVIANDSTAQCSCEDVQIMIPRKTSSRIRVRGGLAQMN